MDYFLKVNSCVAVRWTADVLVLFHVKIEDNFFTCQECIAQVRTCELWIIGNKWKNVVDGRLEINKKRNKRKNRTERYIVNQY